MTYGCETSHVKRVSFLVKRRMRTTSSRVHERRLTIHAISQAAC